MYGIYSERNKSLTYKNKSIKTIVIAHIFLRGRCQICMSGQN